MQGLEYGSDPDYEAVVLALEKVDLIIHLLVDLEREFKSHLVRQFLHQLEHLLRLPLVIVLDDADESAVEVTTELVVVVDLVDDGEALVQFGLDAVLRLDDGREGARGEGKGDDSDDHEKDTEHFL